MRDRRITVLIDGPPRRRDTLVRHLTGVGVNAVVCSKRLRTALWQVAGADIVQRTLHIDVDYPKSMKIFAVARLLGRKTVRYWVGSDVLLALQDKHLAGSAKRLDRITDANVAVAPHLVNELKEIGLKAVALLPPQDALAAAVPPLPTLFRVLVYTRDGCDELYRVPEVLELARRMPDVEFLYVGCDPRPCVLPNVHFLGKTDDMARMYSQTSVLLRLVQHDGMPRMVLEALARARHVLYSVPFPSCIHTGSLEEAETVLRRLGESCPPNDEGREFVQKTFIGPENAQALANAYQDLLNGREIRPWICLKHA